MVFGNVMVGHSGGKDSQVISHLVREVLTCPVEKPYFVHNVKPIYIRDMNPVEKLTAMDPMTLEFLYTKVCREIDITFMHSSQMPEFIEFNDIGCQIDGARSCESGRQGKSGEIIVRGEPVSRDLMGPFVEEGMFGISFIYPIFDWSDDDVFDYLVENSIPFSMEYLKNGEYYAYQGRKEV
jgi:3'-phosphoadenosine 5'-phosphosulfate sulfotransferase (PAPS reductase)/FAD synthetase